MLGLASALLQRLAGSATQVFKKELVKRSQLEAGPYVHPNAALEVFKGNVTCPVGMRSACKLKHPHSNEDFDHILSVDFFQVDGR